MRTQQRGLTPFLVGQRATKTMGRLVRELAAEADEDGTALPSPEGCLGRPRVGARCCEGDAACRGSAAGTTPSSPARAASHAVGPLRFLYDQVRALSRWAPRLGSTGA